MIATISLGQGSEIGLLYAALQTQSASILRKCQLICGHGAFIPLLIAATSSPHFNLLAHFLMCKSAEKGHVDHPGKLLVRQGDQKLSLIVQESVWARPQQPALAWGTQGSCKTHSYEADIILCSAGGLASIKEDGHLIKSVALMAFWH